MTEVVRFCAGCPRAPKGVVAEVKNVEFMDRRQLRERDLFLTSHGKEVILRESGLDNPSSGFGVVETLVACITSEAVEVHSNSGIEVGDEGELFILAGAVTGDDIRNRIAECSKPSRSLPKSIHCGAIAAEQVLAIG